MRLPALAALLLAAAGCAESNPWELAREALREQDYDRALAIYDEAGRSGDPDQFALAKVDVYLRQGKLDTAFQQAVDTAERLPLGWDAQNHLSVVLGDIARRLEKEVDRYTSAEQCDRFDRFLAGYRARCAGIVASKGPAFRASYNFKDVFAVGGKPLQRARFRIELAAMDAKLQADPDDVPALVQRSVLRLKLDDPKLAAAAVVDLDRALVRRPDDPELQYLRGLALNAAQRQGEALAAFRLTLERAPAHPWANYELGLLLGMGTFPSEETLGCFDRAIAALPGPAVFYEARARFKLGELQRGRRTTSKGVVDDCRLWKERLPMDDPDALLEPGRVVAQAQFAEKDYRGAWTTLTALIDAQTEVRRSDRALRVECMLALRKSLDWARSELDILLKDSPRDTKALAKRVTVEALLGETGSARIFFQRLQRLDHRAVEPDWTALAAESAALKAKGELPLTALERRVKEAEEREAAAAEWLRNHPSAAAPVGKTTRCPVCDGKGEHWSSWQPQESYVDSANGQRKTRSAGPTKFGNVTCETCKGRGTLPAEDR